MRPITGQDIIEFRDSEEDLLVLTANGEFLHIEAPWPLTRPKATAYEYIDTEHGEVQILLEASAIDEGEWFPDALDDDGNLIPSVADEMADIINKDGIISGRALKALFAIRDWKAADQESQKKAADRAAAVAELVAYCGDNQSMAARLLNVDPSVVNRLVKKHNSNLSRGGEAAATDSA